VVTLIGIWAGGRVERVLGRKDPGIIVIDEVAGMLLSVVLLPPTIPVLVTAFLLFRLFDIWKPFPARESQALTGGMGVLMDDLIAGVYALVLVLGARALFGFPR
jgi:phosphatidylglycerophosphatase A